MLASLQHISSFHGILQYGKQVYTIYLFIFTPKEP